MSEPSKENFVQSLTADTWCGWDSVSYYRTQIAHERAQEREAGEWLTRQIDKNYERQVKEYGNSRNESGVGNWHGFKGFPPIH